MFSKNDKEEESLIASITYPRKPECGFWVGESDELFMGCIENDKIVQYTIYTQ